MSGYSEIATAQFENVNSLRSYPFVDGTRLLSVDGKQIPSDLIVDMHVIVPASFGSNEIQIHEEGDHGFSDPIVKMTNVHLSQYMVSACFVSFYGSSKNAVSVTVSRENFIPYMPYRLEKLAGSHDIGGIVTFGNFEFPRSPETYVTDAIVSTCCISVSGPPRLKSFIDRRSGEIASGDVSISFSGYIKSEKSGNSFRLYLEDGSEELSSDCNVISSPKECGATPIAMINGVSPDDDGNIVLWFH